MAQSEGQKRATDAVAAEMAERGWTKKDLSDLSEVDYSTVSDLLSYERRIQSRTQGALEKALGWVPGTYRLISLGQLERPERLTEEPESVSAGEDDGLNYRRPEGLTDQEWREIRARNKDYYEWQIEQARRGRQP